MTEIQHVIFSTNRYSVRKELRGNEYCDSYGGVEKKEMCQIRLLARGKKLLVLNCK